ncbi:MAG: ATP synthase F1 subunit delta [Acidobacteriota bacterium]|nr:ATP synthase F1 subunit delta [Acidobacteriota bacterium]
MAPKIDERELAVASLYAEALLGLATAQGAEDDVLLELEGVVELLDRDPDIERAVATPLVDSESRCQTLERSFRGRMSDLLVDTFQVMNRKGRLRLLRALAEAYRQGLEKAKGIVEVQVMTAVALSPENRKRTEEVAARVLEATPRLVETVDPELLGGMVIQVGDRKFDSSVSREISKLGERLFERTAQELLSGKTYFSDGGGGEAAP